MAIVELIPFDLHTEPTKLMALHGLVKSWGERGGGVKLFVCSDKITFKDALDGFNSVAIPSEKLPPDLQVYRSYYEDYLASNIKELLYTRLFLSWPNLDDDTLIRILTGYGMLSYPLGPNGIPLPFTAAVVHWDNAVDNNGYYWGVVQTATQQSGGLFAPSLHNLLNIGFPVWLILELKNYSRQEADQLIRTAQATANVVGGDAKATTLARSDAHTAAGTVNALRQQMMMHGEALHEFRISVVTRGYTKAELFRRLEVVRHAATLSFQRWAARANNLQTLLDVKPSASSSGTFVTSNGVAMLMGGLLSFRRPTNTRGVMLGYDKNAAPIVIDPFDDRNPAYNGVIIGQTGAGKTFGMLLIMLRALLTGTRIVIVDPKGDVGESLSFLGEHHGRPIVEVVKIGSAENPINILDKTFDSDQNQVSFVMGLLSLLGIISKGDALEIAMIDTALSTLYTQTDTPLLSDLRREVMKVDRPAFKTVAERLAFKLEPFITGSKAPFFGKPTKANFSLSSPVTIFDISQLPSRQTGGGLRTALFATLFGLVNQSLVRKANEAFVPTIFFVDEIGVLMRDPTLADYVSDKFKTARSLGVAMWVADQTSASLLGVTDTQNIRHGEEMLANAPFRLIFYQEGDQKQAIKKVFPTLPDAYRDVIHSLARGQCVLQTPTEGCFLVSIVPSELETILLSSRRQDKERARALLKKMRKELL